MVIPTYADIIVISCCPGSDQEVLVKLHAFMQMW